MNKKFRTVTAIKEVVSIVKKSQSSKDTFLWLSNDKDRIQFKISDFSVDDRFYQFSFTIEKNALKIVKPLETYYIKIDYEMSAFKVFVLSITDNRLLCSLPEKVLSLEKRDQQRFKCSKTKIHLAKIKVSNDLLEKSYTTFEFRIIDFSVGGFGLILSEEQIKAFSQSKGNILLTSINGEELEKWLRVETVFFKNINIRKNHKLVNFFRIGFIFAEELDENNFEFFRSQLI